MAVSSPAFCFVLLVDSNFSLRRTERQACQSHANTCFSRDAVRRRVMRLPKTRAGGGNWLRICNARRTQRPVSACKGDTACVPHRPIGTVLTAWSWRGGRNRRPDRAGNKHPCLLCGGILIDQGLIGPPERSEGPGATAPVHPVAALKPHRGPQKRVRPGVCPACVGRVAIQRVAPCAPDAAVAAGVAGAGVVDVVPLLEMGLGPGPGCWLRSQPASAAAQIRQSIRQVERAALRRAGKGRITEASCSAGRAPRARSRHMCLVSL